jgi:hypothetical protein
MKCSYRTNLPAGTTKRIVKWLSGLKIFLRNQLSPLVVLMAGSGCRDASAGSAYTCSLTAPFSKGWESEVRHLRV